MTTTSTDTIIEVDPGRVIDLDRAWAEADGHALYHTGTLADFRANAATGAARIAVRETAGGVRLILPFLKRRIAHKFTIGERLVGQMTFDGLALANPWCAEGHDLEEVAAILGDLLRIEGADVLSLGEIPENSMIALALNRLPLAARPLAVGRKTSRRWLIRLPSDFETYLGVLSQGTRQTARRKIKKLRQSFDTHLEVVTCASEVRRFLEAGERISRLTYQWNVGQRLVNDHTTTERYQALAKEGRLRCYLLSLDGTPCAFLRGTLEGKLYHYETPGFDPAYGQHSIGLVTLLEAIRDLVENTDTEVFDFGVGGDESGYKSSFGTDSVICNSWLVVRVVLPRGLALIAAHSSLNSLKNLAARIVPEGELRNRLKLRLRKYGG